MQPVDLTTLTAIAAELRAHWLPARLEQVYQRDRFTLCLALRTLRQRAWLHVCWHPQAAHLAMGTPPPKTPDTFTFSDQLRHQLGNLALTAIHAANPWERVLDLQFAKRPGEPALWHLYVEIMNKYSNVILTNAENLIVTAAHQVNEQQSSVRPILTGQPYELPPSLTRAIPSLSEFQQRWQDRVSVVPGLLKRRLLEAYRGLSPALVQSLIAMAGLDPNQTTETLTDGQWQQLFIRWLEWLQSLEKQEFQPGWTSTGYTVLGWQITEPVGSVQELIHRYYTDYLNQQTFSQLEHQVQQKLKAALTKLRQKAQGFETRLQQSDQADAYRAQADLLMAHLHAWKPGMTSITLADFETEQPVKIPLDPEKNAIANAQALYKRHQKLKRARSAVEPLLAEVNAEIQYLEQVEAALCQLDGYQSSEDLQTLEEIRDELIQQGYLAPGMGQTRPTKGQDGSTVDFHRYTTPSGFELLIGRNNRQNDYLSFRLAGDYDLWFHTQEIPGSHVLMRLPPGMVPEESDLQRAADLAAYHSQGRHSDQVPVIYTEPKYVYKPKGAKPGMVIYKQERVLWGHPQQGLSHSALSSS